METHCGPDEWGSIEAARRDSPSRRQAARLEARQPHPIEAADHYVLVLATQHVGQQLAEEGELRQGHMGA